MRKDPRVRKGHVENHGSLEELSLLQNAWQFAETGSGICDSLWGLQAQ